MEPEETAAIVRYVKSLCPQQKIDQFTYEVWHDVIGELEFQQARNAVIAVVHSQPFVSASDIITAARRRPHPSDRTVAEALEASNLRALGAVPPTPATAEFHAARQALEDRLAARIAGTAARFDQRLKVACPWCHASPMEQCVNIGTGMATRPHEARAQAAKGQAA